LSDTPTSTDAAASPRGGLLDGLATVVATGLGSGYSPLAPGTAGSAVGLLLFWPMRGLSPLALALAIALVSAAGVAAASRVARRAGQEDPGRVVVDEVAGMWVTLWLLPATPLLAALGFVAFRVMDVWKPWPARDLERLPGGWGIMADDLMAGVYANLLLRVLLLSGLVPA
jgi:phosphatidylglycerophosphatase A